MCTVTERFQNLLGAENPAPARYDLLIKGRKVVDPSQNLSALRDLAMVGNKIASVAENLDPALARKVLDAKEKIVTPGLIDVYVHVYDGVAPIGIPADPSCIAGSGTDGSKHSCRGGPEYRIATCHTSPHCMWHRVAWVVCAENRRLNRLASDGGARRHLPGSSRRREAESRPKGGWNAWRGHFEISNVEVRIPPCNTLPHFVWHRVAWAVFSEDAKHEHSGWLL
jgi:hypothetical protein